MSNKYWKRTNYVRPKSDAIKRKKNSRIFFWKAHFLITTDIRFLPQNM